MKPGISSFSEWAGRRFVPLAAMLVSFMASPEMLSRIVGHPPTRFYSLDDIGGVSPGFRLIFDPLGRIGVVSHDKYMVLNDDWWINRISERTSSIGGICGVAFGQEGQAYYTSHGSWGRLGDAQEGDLLAEEMSPFVRPDWTRASELEHILVVEGGVFFYNWNGLIYWDRSTGQHTFREVVGLERLFVYRDVLLVSIVSTGILKLDLAEGTLEAVPEFSSIPGGVRHSIPFAADGILFYRAGHGFHVLDDDVIRHWPSDLDGLEEGVVVDVANLGGGMIAVAVEGQGIHVLSADGRLQLSLTGDTYAGVKEVVANEPGLLWYSTDAGVGKVFYASGVTVIDQRSGIRVGWPEVCRWGEKILIGSEGRIYESVEGPHVGRIGFQTMEDQPDILNVAVGAWSDYLFVGNREGLFGKRAGESLATILPDLDVARVVAVDDELCYVIGPHEITALRLEAGQWVECVSRVPGLGFPSVVHRIGRSVWIELGLNRVGRVSLKDGELVASAFEGFPWDEPGWINIGAIGGVAIMSSRGNRRVYFDEVEEAFREAPELDELLALCPFDVLRMVEDGEDRIWLSHDNGVSELRRVEGRWEFHFGLARHLRERSPILSLLGPGDLWVVGRHSLHHSTSVESTISKYCPPQPVVVQVRDSRLGHLVREVSGSGDFGEIPYGGNTLDFRFFAGTYALERLSYRVEVEGGFSAWSLDRASSLVTLPNLKEGRYRLNVTLMDADVVLAAPIVLSFRILPPWYRSGAAYGVYAVIVLAVMVLLAIGPMHLARNRNLVLSRLVKERTRELEAAMERLREEEKSRAIHEERNRIADEIHDSVQQGLSGLRLVIDSTLKLASLPEEARNRLLRARSILAFTFQEMKHAVWDMESPLLEDNDLVNALKRLASLMNTGTTSIQVISGDRLGALPALINHHLLRITQESITNAIQHGKARNISVALHLDSGWITLCIMDDGSGFEVDELAASFRQHGLRGLLKRVSQFKGKVEIESKPDEGTRVVVMVPLQEGDLNEQ